jgi:hypothetical protein
MLSAQDNPAGVPKELLEAKKQELKQEQVCIEYMLHGQRHYSNYAR